MTAADPVECDLLIVGAGPVGLFGAFYAGLRGLTVAVMDSLPEVGGQITAMYPEKIILDVAGLPAIRGRDLVDGLMNQLKPYPPRWLLGERADRLESTGDVSRLVVTSHLGTTVRVGAVLITGGIGSFSPRPLPAAAAWAGDGVCYFVPQPQDHAGRDVVIVGGGDSAFDWAETLHPIARSVLVVHRRDRFRAHQATVDRVRALGVPVRVFSEVTELIGDGTIDAVRVSDTKTGFSEVLPCQTVVAALGFKADIGPLAGWGMTLDKRRVITDHTGATSLPRVFAAGDIATYPGKVALIATGFGEVATAVNNAAIVIDPSALLFPGHTSEMNP